MWCRVALALLLVAATTEVQAANVATYGAGLLSCRSYLDSRNKENSSDEVTFVDWLGGYLSGANTTSIRRNNLLGLSDVKAAMERLDRICLAKPEAPFGNAMGMVLMGANSTPGAHSVEVTKYGSGFKPCSAYIASRQPQSFDSEEFINWLGGYVSGANAISAKTNDVLGASDLTQAVFWLDDYCDTHPLTQFAMAVNALIDESRQMALARH